MSYWVYENWVAESKAVIHLGACRFCNEGAGTGRNVRGERNGKWHGRFGSFDEADVAARKTGRPVRSCRCVPQQSRSKAGPPLAPLPVPNVATPTASGPGQIRGLTEIGFERAGVWRLDPAARGGVQCKLDAFRNDRVVYSFVVDESVVYIGICDSSGTVLTDRMSRYQNLAGAGTNERIVGLIRKEISEGHAVQIYALKPAPRPKYMNLEVDYVRGLELPLIERFNPPWNKRR